MKKCPYCAEEIQDEAILCRYCNSRLDTQTIDTSPLIKKCPYCSKEIRYVSTVCEYCNNQNETEDSREEYYDNTEEPITKSKKKTKGPYTYTKVALVVFLFFWGMVIYRIITSHQITSDDIASLTINPLIYTVIIFNINRGIRKYRSE